MNFADNLKQLRSVYQVTQEQLAQHLHVSRPTIAGYETKNKQPDFDKLIQISSFFHVSIDYMLTGHEFQGKTAQDPDEQDYYQAISGSHRKREVLHKVSGLGEQDLNDLCEYLDFLNYRSKK